MCVLAVTLDVGLQALLTMFLVIDPVGLVPVYLALVRDRPPAQQRAVARRSVLIAGGILTAFAILGATVLGYLGISTIALQVAGGILLFRIAMDMVFASHRRDTREEDEEARSRDDVSVFPLAIPMIAGPGAIASLLVLTGGGNDDPFALGVVLLATAMVLALAYLLLRLGTRISAALGQTGVNVVTRVLGVLLAALAVQYVADGLSVWWP